VIIEALESSYGLSAAGFIAQEVTRALKDKLR